MFVVFVVSSFVFDNVINQQTKRYGCVVTVVTIVFLASLARVCTSLYYILYNSTYVSTLNISFFVL